jgi:cation transport ATPase
VPVAFKAAMVRAAERGVLLRGGAAIERLAAVDTLVLDASAGLTDSDLREDAASTVTRLRALGIRRLVLVAEAASQQAAALAAALAVDAWHAEVAPAAKVDLVAALRAEGCRVGYAGEDAAALAAADAGIAVARGADIAEVGVDLGADVVLLDEHPAALAVAREIAGKTMGLVRRNFAAVATMETGILGGAVLGRLSPVASAFLHNGTTIATLLHALKGVAVDGAAADRPGPAGAVGSPVPAPPAAAPRVSCVQGRSAAPGSRRPG